MAADRLILIVDDSPEDRAAVRRHLSQDAGADYRFIEAGDGPSGLDACRAEPPACLVLDFDMPGVDGLDFLDALAEFAGRGTIAVVMITGRGNEVTAVGSLKRGAQDYLVKGHYTPGTLRQTVADAIEKVDNQREMATQHAELDRLYREARESDRRKDEFLAMLAHELRNPLAPIRNASKVLRLNPDPEIQRQMGEVIDRQIGHMGRLLDDLLDVSRISRGRITLRREGVDLDEAVNRAVETVRPPADHLGPTLTVTPAAQPITLTADPTRFEQVLINLLTNALKYTDPGGEVRVSVEAAPGEAIVRVSDTGVGIAPEMLSRVFDLFAQADRSLDRSQGGLGIGLTLVRLLVELHGGTVSASSPGLGRGSEFVVRLPTAFEETSPSSVAVGLAGADGVAGADGGAGAVDVVRRRILILDDNAPAAESLAMLVDLSGHEARVAHNGEVALALAPKFRPDVVLLDIGLPGMDGYEVARRLRGLPDAVPTLRLIAVTGYGRDDDRRRGLDAGIDHHLVKPVDYQILERLINEP